MSDDNFPMQPLPSKERSFLEAAKEGSVERLQALLAEGVPVDVQDVGDEPWNQTALMYAAQSGHLCAVKFLLRAGSRVFARDKSLPGEPAGRQPLHYAARTKNVDVIDVLLDAGANPNAMDSMGDTPVNTAIWEGNIEVVRLLLRRGADPNLKPKSKAHNPPLLIAAMAGKSEMVKLLIEVGADPNGLGELRQTPIIVAAYSEDDQVAYESSAALVRAGADINRRDKFSSTALFNAALRKAYRTMELLLHAGANTDFVYDRQPGTLMDIADGGIRAMEEKCETLPHDDPWLPKYKEDLARWKIVAKMLLEAGAKRCRDL
jgi:ankyrin repeat protein